MKKTVDLECNGLGLIQDDDGYTFTTDAVLLANLITVKDNERIIELGSGSGVISFLLSQKTNAKEIFGVEIQKGLFEMSLESLKLNKLSDKIQFINADLKEAHTILGANSFDVVYSNPPYEKADIKGFKNEEIAICKSELKTDLNEILSAAKKLLKFQGRFYLIHKAERLPDVFFSMKNNGIEPAKLILIKQTPDKEPDRVIVEGRKGSKGKLKIEEFTLLEKDGSYSERARRIYNR